MKTKITPFLMLALLWLALPVVTQAQFTFVTNGDDTITITGYTGTDRNVNIPSTINGYPVTTVGNAAFWYKQTLTGIIIPNSVAGIGSSAFSHCYGLTNVTIPDSVTSIGDEAFEYCSGLTNVTLPNSVTNIGDWAFSDCFGLTSVTIPDSVTRIGAGAFGLCSGLTNITVKAANPSYAGAGGVLFNKALTLLIQCPGGLAGNYAIPDSVVSIQAWAFYSCFGMTNVTIPHSVISIGDSAFESCWRLTGVTIPNSVTSIGDSAFGGCSGLTNVTIPNSVTSVGFRAFKYCSGLTDVTISDSVTNIGRYAFLYCMQLRHIYFQGNAPSVDGGAGSEDSTVFYLGGGTVYYLPGSTGWGATFGGRPTAWWYQLQPQILCSAHGLGVQSKGFQFTISWATNAAVVVEASTNLQNWTPVITNSLVNGTNAFWDSDWTHYPQRFYRVCSRRGQEQERVKDD